MSTTDKKKKEGQGLEGVPRIEKIVEAEAGGDATEQFATVDKAVDAAKRPREFSFLQKNPDSFEAITTPIGEVTVPATIGSTYWAILKVLYENANSKVFTDDLCSGVAKYMEERDATLWNKYTAKTKTTVFHKAEQKRAVKDASSWQSRIVGNAKTLTRVGGDSPYGKRLIERKHCLVFGHDNGKPYFCLHNNLGPIQAKLDKLEKIKAE